MLNSWDIGFFRKQLKILKMEIEKWQVEDIQRLLALLNLEQLMEPILPMDSPSNLLKIEFLEQTVEPKLKDTTYLPYQKFKCIVNFLQLLHQETQDVFDDLYGSTLVPRPQTKLPDCYISYDETIVLKLKQIVDNLDEQLIIQLSTLKIMSILKKLAFNQEQISLVKKYNCDGFTLVCTLTHINKVNELRGLLTEEDLNFMLSLSFLFLTQYYRQMLNLQTEISQKKQQGKIKELNLQGTQMNSSTQFPKKAQESIQFLESIDPLMKCEQANQNEISQSQYAYGESQYGFSERGSFLAESVYARESYIPFYENQRRSRLSDMYDIGILVQLQEACLDLPFNLLNLDPLQTIKIRAMVSPFGKQIDKEYYWTYSLQGAKFGRDKENDFRYPDELSISSKHAQIFFRDNSFFLQDLGSKTGTFLKIKGLIKLVDETCIQLTHDTQIIFTILKKQKNEGTIKAEIKKPLNLPDYKISVRDNFKIKIGKSENCHFRIDIPSLAEKHAEIYYRDGVFSFRDCSGFSSGCWRRLSQRSIRSEGFKLSKGDIFRLSSKKSFYIQEIENYEQKIDTKI